VVERVKRPDFIGEHLIPSKTTGEKPVEICAAKKNFASSAEGNKLSEQDRENLFKRGM
jgi:hypothetical protein